MHSFAYGVYSQMRETALTFACPEPAAWYGWAEQMLERLSMRSLLYALCCLTLAVLPSLLSSL